MAGRYPYYTSSGREVKPTWKLKEEVRDMAAKAFNESLDKLAAVTTDLKKVVGDGRTFVLVRDVYHMWRSAFDHLLDRERDFSRHLHGDELRQHTERFRADVEFHEKIRVHAERYLDDQRHRENDSLEQKRVLDEETTQLEEQIKKIELELSRNKQKMSAKSEQTQEKRKYLTPEYSTRFNEPRYSTPANRGYGSDLYDFIPKVEPNVSYIRQTEDPLSYRRQFYQEGRTQGEERMRDERERRYFEDVKIPAYGDYQSKPAYDARYSFQPAGQHQPRHEYDRFGRDAAPLDPTAAVLSKLADVLQEKKDKKLPTMQPDTFSGDIMLFPDWIASFEALIEGKTSTPSERLFWLGKYTDGEVNALIRGFLKLGTEEAYVRAKMTLIGRYGDKLRIAELYKHKLFNWPIIKNGEREKLQKFSDFLWQCHSAMENIGYLSSLDAPDENKKLMRRLPYAAQDRWNRVVDAWVYGAPPDQTMPMSAQTGPYPPYLEFCRFVANEARVMNGPCAFNEMKKDEQEEVAKTGRGSDKKSYKKSTALAVTSHEDKREEKSENKTKPPWKKSSVAENKNSSNTDKEKPIKCFHCEGEHYLSNCEKFLKCTADFKKKFAMERGICFGCLRKGHRYRTCTIRRPELMKTDGGEESGEKEKNEKNETHGEEKESLNLYTRLSKQSRLASMILPVYVYSRENPRHRVKTYVAVDSQSDSCFVSRSLLESLSVDTVKVQLKLTTMGSSKIVSSEKVENLIISGVNEESMIDLPECYAQEMIPASKRNIPSPEDVAKWPHLKKMSRMLEPVDDDMEIGMLVGFNCSEAFITTDHIHGNAGEPFGAKLRMGWSVMGDLTRSDREEQDDENHLCFITSTREVSVSEIRRVFDTGFELQKSEEMMSQEDRRFLTIMHESVKLNENGHFQVDLPMKKDAEKLPNNRPLAEKRLLSLKKKLDKDPVYAQRYQEFIDTMVEKGQAEMVDENEEVEDGMVNYIPHMGVYHPRKPGKLRVVFDGSAKYMMTCLNENLLTGPDQLNSLIGVLLNFRLEKVAVVCDVEGMFHQVEVTPRFRNLLRFLWYRDGKVVVMRMKVHLFGATSSPGCTNFVFKQLAVLFGDEYGSLTKDFILRHFYVDDGVVSIGTPEMGIDLVFSSNGLCARGGFLLHKFGSNCPEVVDQIPERLRAKELKNWSLHGDSLPTEVTLGIHWDMQRDCLIFIVALLSRPMTRRGMLSALGSIYDPLGLIAPIILEGRDMLKELCMKKFSWDEEVPEQMVMRWRNWYERLSDLQEMKIPRCVSGQMTSELTRVKLHHFADASTIGYGACSYLRLQDEYGAVEVNLVMAKARVTPAKVTTIPRLELQAAVLATKMGRFLTSELQYENVKNYFYTDSLVTLGYIQNSHRRFHIYVTNRVASIRNVSEPEDWRHIPTEINPADLASRGEEPRKLADSSVWWHGPPFLKETDENIPKQQEFQIEDTDPEIKREKVVLLTKRVDDVVLLSLNRWSTWTKAKRVLATCMRFLVLLKMKREQRKLYNPTNMQLKVGELTNAEKYLVRTIQKNEFDDVYEEMKMNKNRHGDDKETQRRFLKRCSTMYKLDVYMDGEDLLRVGGRLEKSGLAEAIVHPYLMPKEGHGTTLLIRHYHKKFGHPGRNATLAHVHIGGWWIIRGRAAVDRVTRKCVICKNCVEKHASRKCPVSRNLEPHQAPLLPIVAWTCSAHSRYVKGEARRRGGFASTRIWS